MCSSAYFESVFFKDEMEKQFVFLIFRNAIGSPPDAYLFVPSLVKTVLTKSNLQQKFALEIYILQKQAFFFIFLFARDKDVYYMHLL